MMPVLYPHPLEFGRDLITTEDLDPIYVMLHRGRVNGMINGGELSRWLLAYWCFYHAGVASRIAEAPGFWATMIQADVEKWPRGTERRHFRGAASAKAILWLSKKYSHPEDAVQWVAHGGTFQEVSARVRTWPMFGPWIAFKVADMVDRVLGIPVDFSRCLLAFYREPASAAQLLGVPLDQAVADLIGGLGHLAAPPSYDRPINVQEIETVLCKWKSHMGGHYPMGKDTKEIRHGLVGWGPLAERLAAGLP